MMINNVETQHVPPKKFVRMLSSGSPLLVSSLSPSHELSTPFHSGVSMLAWINDLQRYFTQIQTHTQNSLRMNQPSDLIHAQLTAILPVICKKIMNQLLLCRNIFLSTNCHCHVTQPYTQQCTVRCKSLLQRRLQK